MLYDFTDGVRSYEMFERLMLFKVVQYHYIW
jgi:hypothetical protein